ncbi:hypothetical protein AB9N12_11725 [Bacteroides sp. AN502(2024)]|uniref:hypothetical protein n=1 Tax=Bacteroides sp. AN502(2024) TaxID=3160599 RepID=UPI00351851FD
MKKIGIFIAGVICGVALAFLIGIIASGISDNRGITSFEEAGEYVSENSFEVFQVLDSGDALAYEYDGTFDLPTGIIVLFVAKKGKSYYDNQRIEIPSGKCAKQIGIYKYTTNSGSEKTVPVVDICNK